LNGFGANKCSSDLIEEFLAFPLGFFLLRFLRGDVDFRGLLRSAEAPLFAAAKIGDDRRDCLVGRPEEFLAGQDSRTVLLEKCLDDISTCPWEFQDRQITIAGCTAGQVRSVQWDSGWI
jgi:hypothetical protein